MEQEGVDMNQNMRGQMVGPPTTLDLSFLESARYKISKTTTTQELNNIFTLPSVGCTGMMIRYPQQRRLISSGNSYHLIFFICSNMRLKIWVTQTIFCLRLVKKWVGHVRSGSTPTRSVVLKSIHHIDISCLNFRTSNCSIF